MQVPSVPPPIVTSALPQDVAAKAVPTAQAVAPLVSTAVDPSHKDEIFKQVERDKNKPKDKRKDKKDSSPDDDRDNHAVNISI